MNDDDGVNRLVGQTTPSLITLMMMMVVGGCGLF